MSEAMNIIIAGSRDFDDYRLLKKTVSDYIEENQVNNTQQIRIISGGAKGADRLGECYAFDNGYSVIRFQALWGVYGKSAGPRRNNEMAKFASESGSGTLIAFWDGESRGTKNMIDTALEGIGAFTVIILAIFTLVISPALSFMFAYIGGCILKFFVGDALVNGLNIIFNTTRFTKPMIPVICATIATIGKYFKTTVDMSRHKGQ